MSTLLPSRLHLRHDITRAFRRPISLSADPMTSPERYDIVLM